MPSTNTSLLVKRNDIRIHRIRLTEVIGHQCLIAERMLRANSHDRFVCLHRPKAFDFTCRLSPFELFLEHMEEGDDISKTATEPVSIIYELDKTQKTHLCRGTLPYVTDTMRTSSSSGLALRASSRAMISSTPCTC